ncbi:MAG: hypothetical protein AAF492_29580, partial [Verrucomicrobiota bacterium]
MKDRPYVQLTGDRDYATKGFLLNDQPGKSFTLLDDYFQRTTYLYLDERSGTALRFAYRKLDLQTEMKDLLKTTDENDSVRGFGVMFSQRAQWFVWSWVCARHGLHEEAMKLYEVATEAKKSYYGRRQYASEPPDFFSRLKLDLGHSMMWQGVVNFGDPTYSRKELLQQFDDIVRHIPNSTHVERAEKTANLLRRMIKEDEEHVVKPAAERSREEEIAQWIFQLRDQNGFQLGQPGGCSIFTTADGSTNSPAHQLERIGLDAIPQLIETLDDERFSRSVGYHRNFYFSHEVLRIGDCARQVIEEISGRSFHGNDTAVITAQAEEWWQDVQNRGEKTLLIEGVSRGGYEGYRQAFILKNKYPEVAAEALRKGIEN